MPRIFLGLKKRAMRDSLPYLTHHVSAIEGTAKADYLDFFVEEIPLYKPKGIGDHVYFVVEKQGLTTNQAVREVARALGASPREIGVAGQKDARGVTRQMMSVEHRNPEKVAALSIPRIRILEVSRHGNKLKIGHLSGNRFVLKVRNTPPKRLSDIQAVVKALVEKGVPNYYGPQRFGYRGDNWAVGRALLQEDFETACRLIAGGPNEMDSGQTLEARALYDKGRFLEAASAWPRGFREASVVAKAMHRFGGDVRRALFSLDKKMLSFYVSAYQSQIFNAVLAARIHELASVERGDVASKEENGALFLVEDELAEKARVDRFEISATGPIFGHKMKAPTHRIQLLETKILTKNGGFPEMFPAKGPLRCRGGRRPLRVMMRGFDMREGRDQRGEFVQLSFSLPPGSYATSVLREIFKSGLILSDGPRDSESS